MKSFQAPTTPQAPSTPSDFASELAAYETPEPTFATVEATKAPSVDGTGQGAKEYLAFIEADLPKADHHH